ncbi:hypothetical protein [Micromonospora sp. DT47]|uniref:hypothetical protein n=1 Tax=Micromonospora sp. DT47 TaxID=3393431 RepID=UPI003CE92085
MTRTRRLLPAALLLVAALAGCSSDPEPSAAPSPSTAATTGRPAAIEIECANIDRAHRAWQGPPVPQSAVDAAGITELDVKMAMEDGEAYLRAVEGHADQPSKALASAIAQYNLDLAILNAELTIGGKADDKTALAVAVAARKVHDDYAAWQNATCV